ncbi:outer membrane protein assembly factor BamA [Lichenihabitans psoromatis]|uniref:outer membrane protein assembly factor BamA n=1 Tax=Lichenihabitans psoromatis TaxID=2528642 RepID=UPI001036B185|nr:outer membrane protein assembly factor BamA [Lichenihabitans psoromatis]
MQFLRGFLNRLAFITVLSVMIAGITLPASAASIVVEGNRRVDAETVRSYFTGADQGNVNQSIKDLYATGLFSDVRVSHRGAGLVVTVVENGVINRVAFEGNSKIKGDQMASAIQSKSRGPYSPATVQADIERIKEIYQHNGRGLAKVTARTVDLPNGRLDVVFTIDEGDKTGVKSIDFVGNKAFGSGKLRGLMQTTESNYLSFFKTSDVYDADKVAADQEAIRRFYLRNGYADFRIVGSDVKFDPEAGGYHITITVEEGAQYTVGAVRVESHLSDVSGEQLTPIVRLSAGDVYDGDLVEKSTEGLTREVQRRGYAFSEVRPRGDRNPSTHTVNLGFVIDEGPRVYIERIDVHGNTRTRDYVIRREFDIGEGDPYNKVMIDRAERRLNSLGFFKKVRITNLPGSSADRVIINVDVEDQPTGSFSISGGYSTSDGFIAEAAVTETNFLGRGQYVKLGVQEGQYARGVDFSFTEPYIFDTRIAAGFDIFAKQNDNTQYALYETFVTGGTLRLGIPITDEFSISPHYSIYNTKISIPNKSSQPSNDCVSTGGVPIDGTTPGYGTLVNVPATATNNCLTNGEASIAIKEALGSTLTNLVGFNLNYNTLDNPKNPTSGLFAEIRTDVGFDTGLGNAGGQRDNTFVRSTGDLRYYHPIYDDIIGFVRLQGGHVEALSGQLRITDQFQLGPTLVRGFAPSGIGARDISDPTNAKYNPLGGSTYFGGSLETQFPLYGLPRDLGLKGAFFADAGTLFGYTGRTNFTPGGGACVAGGQATGVFATNYQQGTCVVLRDSDAIRSSVGASLIWASPLGPIRFDYAYALSKDKYDQTQAFRFSGGTSF